MWHFASQFFRRVSWLLIIVFSFKWALWWFLSRWRFVRPAWSSPLLWFPWVTGSWSRTIFPKVHSRSAYICLCILHVPSPIRWNLRDYQKSTNHASSQRVHEATDPVSTRCYGVLRCSNGQDFKWQQWLHDRLKDWCFHCSIDGIVFYMKGFDKRIFGCRGSFLLSGGSASLFRFLSNNNPHICVFD